MSYDNFKQKIELQETFFQRKFKKEKIAAKNAKEKEIYLWGVAITVLPMIAKEFSAQYTYNRSEINSWAI